MSLTDSNVNSLLLAQVQVADMGWREPRQASDRPQGRVRWRDGV